MRNTLIVSIILLAVALGACKNPSLQNPNPHLNICEADDVADMGIRFTMGSGELRILEVDYQMERSFNTDITHDLHKDDMVPVPFCNQQGIGDISFLVEVTPDGPGLLYGYEYSAEMYFEVDFPNADIEIYDTSGFGNVGYGSAGIGVHTDGGPQRFRVEIQKTPM